MSAAPSPITVLLRSEETGGAVSVMRNTASADFPGPPLHRHDFDEAFYVLEGELTLQLGDELFTRGPGELAFAPRGTPHTFANLSGAPARFLLVCTPAGFERYFARLAAEHDGVDPPEWALQPIPKVTRVGPRISRPAP
jgi:quercetin dioxygenase-like cupin family protein